MSFFDEQDVIASTPEKQGGFFADEDIAPEGPAAFKTKRTHDDLLAQHKANMAESNPSAGARADALVDSATKGLVKGAADFVPGLLKMGYHAGQALGGNVVDPATGKIPIWEDVKGMAAGVGEDIGNVSAVLPSWLGGQGGEMPLEQYKKAGEAVGKNVGVVAGAEMLPTAIGVASKAAKPLAKVVTGPPNELALKVVKPRATDLRFTTADSVAKTFIDEVPTGKTKREILENTTAAKQRANNELTTKLSTPAAANKKVKLQDALDAVDDVMNKAAQSNNQPLFDRISNFRDSLEHHMAADAEGNIQMGEARNPTMSPLEANELKKWIDDSTVFTEDAVEKGVNEAKFAARKALRDGVERQVPGAALTLKKTGDLIVIERALKRQEIRPGFDDLLGKASHHEGPMSLVPGIATASKFLNAPAMQMTVAKWLDSMGTAQRANIAAQYANKVTPDEALPTPPIPADVPKSFREDYLGGLRDFVNKKLKQDDIDAASSGTSLPDETLDAAGVEAKKKVTDYLTNEAQMRESQTLDESNPLGIDLNQVAPATSAPPTGKMGYNYNPARRKLIVNRSVANDIADAFNMPLFNGAEFNLKGGVAPAIEKLKQTMPTIFDKISSDKPLTVQVEGADYKGTARHEGTHRAVTDANLLKEPWQTLDTPELTKAMATKKHYVDFKRAEEVYADLMAGRGDTLGLTRSEALQLTHDMTEHITQLYGQEAANTVMRRFIPQKRVTNVGGEQVVSEPESFKYK